MKKRKHTVIPWIDLAAMTDGEAAELPPVSPSDEPVTIRFGGRETRWNSRETAREFYRLRMWPGNGGSAGDRFGAVWTGLACGDPVPADGLPLAQEA